MRVLARGAVDVRLFDILHGDTTPQMTAEEAESNILSEFERLGGVRNVN